MNIIRKILKILAWAIVGVLILDAFLVASFAVFSSQYEKADAIVVMGAAINSPALYYRSLAALDLYRADYAPVLVLSGGRISDKDITEATYMQRAIQSKSEKPLNLILEEDSHNTYENLKNTRERLGEGKTIIIVTDKYHLARSVIMAKALGFK